MVMDQLIPFHKQNKKVRSEKMIDYLILETKHAISRDDNESRFKFFFTNC
jgi:hypothetical protein